MDLLRDYSQPGSETALAELVARDLDLIYSAALRQVKSSKLAEAVAQLVSAELAKMLDASSPRP